MVCAEEKFDEFNKKMLINLYLNLIKGFYKNNFFRSEGILYDIFLN